MGKHKHVIDISNVPLDKLNAPADSAFGGTRRNLISIDVGGWYGRHREDWNDIANGPYKTSKMTVLPMAGLSYFFAVH